MSAASTRAVPAGGTDDRPISVSYAFVGAFAAYLSLSLTAIVAVARSGLETPSWALLAGPLVLTTSVFSPFLLPLRVRLRLESQPAWLAVLVLLVWLSPVLSLPLGAWLGVVYPATALLGVVRALPSLRRLSWPETLVLGVLPPVVALYLFSQLHSMPFAHVLSPEATLLGMPGLDPALHTTLSTMIQNFGQPSVAIDGLVPMRYHVGSHTWFAGLATIAGVMPLLAYPLGQICVAVPMLYAATYFASVSIARRTGSAAPVILAATLVIWIFDRIGWTTYYISESFTFGLASFLLTLPLLIDLVENPRRGSRADALRFGALLVGAAILCAMKLSAGYVYCVAFGFVVLRLYGFSRRSTAVLAALGAIAIASLHFFSARTGLVGWEMISPLHFYRETEWGRLLDPMKAHSSLVLPVLYLLLAGWQRKPTEDPGQRVVVEMVAVTTVAAHLPGLILALWNATAWWFQNVPQWMLIPLLIGRFLPIPGQARSKRALAVVVASVLLLLAASPIRELPARYIKLAVGLRRQIAALSGAPPVRYPWPEMRRSFTRGDGLFDRTARNGIEASPMARGAAWISEHAQNQPDAAVFVPPSNLGYYLGVGKQNLTRLPRAAEIPLARRCLFRPLVIPMLTGVPMLKGIGPDCPNFAYLAGYGQGDYGPASRSSELSEEALCHHARSRGVSSILVLQSLEDLSANHVIHCGA